MAEDIGVISRDVETSDVGNTRSSTPRHSITPFLLPEDQAIVNQIGFPGVMAIIAKHYGFDIDVAMNTFFATKSIEKTKLVLQQIMEVANSATSVLLAELAQGDGVDSCSDDQPPDDVSLPVDHHRIFFKRISEGQSTLNEDEDDPIMLKLAQEHRDLVMNVTEENADTLRSFEQRNNQDLLRLWSLDWVRQKIADM